MYIVYHVTCDGMDIHAGRIPKTAQKVTLQELPNYHYYTVTSEFFEREIVNVFYDRKSRIAYIVVPKTVKVRGVLRIIYRDNREEEFETKMELKTPIKYEVGELLEVLISRLPDRLKEIVRRITSEPVSNEFTGMNDYWTETWIVKDHPEIAQVEFCYKPLI